MASFANLSANLKLNIQDFSSKLKSASDQVNKFSKNIKGETVDSMKELNKQTTAWGLNLKSVSRVVSGILISQAFYSILRSVREATDAVWEFTKQLEYAHIAYSNLFGDTSLAVEFINVLKDFAAKTPFSFTEAEKASKRLLAYGIEYKNVMYVMQGVMSAAAIQGDSAKIEAISRAFGQIYTYGKLMTQEVRQLSEAGIPAYEILQEELGLTQEQLRNLGNEAIPASVAINALVDGIQKRFGNVTVAASKTITGIVSNIKDNATMLFASLFEPMATVIKSALVEVGEFFYALREIVELKGAGGVFEALFPPEMHAVLRQFIANFQNLGLAVTRLVIALGGLLKPIVSALITLFNSFAPVITLVANVLAEVVSIIVNNATAMKILTAALVTAASMWVIFKTRALAAAVVSAVITGISKALAGLSTMLTFVVAHPFWALLIGLGGVLVGLSIGFGNLGDKVSNFFKQLTQFNGVDPDKVLLPSQKERANDLDKFNNKLDGTADAMDDLADSTGKATKAAKGLLSFDEVFKLNEPDEGTGNGIETPDLEGLLEGLDGLGDAYMPEVPDFSSYMDSVLNGFKDAWNKIKEKMATIIGGAFGALVGGALGGVVGAIVGHFWNMLADHFGLTPDQKVKAGIIGGIGATLGAIFGGILGGPLGAKVGAIIGGFVGSFWGIFAEYFGITPTQHLATIFSGALAGALKAGFSIFKSLAANLIPTYIDDVFVGFSTMIGFSFKGALVGGLKQGVVGAIVGLGTGILANAITGWIAKELELTEQDLSNSGVGQTIGNIGGTLVGLLLGGPIGSLVGGALGQLGGAIIGEFWAYMNNTLKGAVIGGAAGLPVGTIVGMLVGSIGGPLGAGLGAAIGTALGLLVGLIVDCWDEISQFFAWLGKGIANLFSNIGQWLVDLGAWFSDLGAIIVDFAKDAWSTLSEFFGNVWDFIVRFSGIFVIIGKAFVDLGIIIWDSLKSLGSIIGNAFVELWDMFKQAGSDLLNIVSGWFKPIVVLLSVVWSAVVKFFTDIFNKVSVVLLGIIDTVTQFFTNVWNSINTFFTDAWSKLTEFLSGVWSDIVGFFTSVIDSITEFLSSIWSKVSKIATDVLSTITLLLSTIWSSIALFASNVWDKVSTFFSTVWNALVTFVSNVLRTVTQYLSNIWNKIVTFFTNTLNKITEVFSNIVNKVTSFISSVWTKVTTFFSNVWTKVTTFFSNVWTKITGFFSNAISKVTGFFSNIWNTITGWTYDTSTHISEWGSNLLEGIAGWFSRLIENLGGWFADLWDSILGWISDIGQSLNDWWDGLWNGKEANVEFHGSVNSGKFNSGDGSSYRTGHATGGIFDREHIARFAEDDKAEAVIPLENASAMQPFVDAIANGLTASLAPVFSNVNSGSQMQPLYVGTLIADDRSLKELERRMEVIRLQEVRR